MLRFFKSCCLYLLIILFTLVCVMLIEGQEWEISVKVGVYGLLVAVSGLFFVLAQMKQMFHAAEVERLRHKKQVTLQKCDALQGTVRTLNKRLEEKFSLCSTDSKRSLNKDDLLFLFSVGGRNSKNRLEELLSFFEQIGLGIRHDIYDLEVVRDMSGTLLAQIYMKYEPFILKVREEQANKGRKTIRYDGFISLMKACYK